MKALLISESDDILNSYAAFFKEAGYDTVCYRWLLKAMDNLEEIDPRVIFIDGIGYPRHWKTLAQYIKTDLHNAPLVLLAADLSEEEAKKADCLDVHCISGSIEDEQTRRTVFSLLYPEQDRGALPPEPIEAADLEDTAELVEATDTAEIPDTGSAGEKQTEPAAPSQMPVEAKSEQIDDEPFFKTPQPAQAERPAVFSAVRNEDPEEATIEPAQAENSAAAEHTTAIDERPNESEAFSFTFFHPRTKTAIRGSTVSFKPPLLYFNPDDSSLLRTLRFGQKSSGVINDKGLASNVSVQIQGFENDSIELCILK